MGIQNFYEGDHVGAPGSMGRIQFWTLSEAQAEAVAFNLVRGCAWLGGKQSSVTPCPEGCLRACLSRGV